MRRAQFGILEKGAAQALILGVSLGALSACDSLLEVDLPHLLTTEAIEGSGTAEVQVNSAIALFECGYSALAVQTLGHEDAMQSIAGVGGGTHGFVATPTTGECDSSSSSVAWFDQIMGARALLTTAPGRLVPTATGVGRGVYDRMEDEWDLGAGENRLKGIAAIYVAASLGHIGEFTCEASIDVSDFLTPTQVLDVAEEWITNRALVHITAAGDFAMPNGISSSAQNMALAIRARIRWANGNLAGAAADAATVLASDPGFNAWVTRETGATRRNKIFHYATDVSFSGMLGINTWWNPAIRAPNPATGQPWPDPIPFTGTIFLGIMPDGRTLEAGNVPVRWAEDAIGGMFGNTRDANGDPVPLLNGAVADTRVPHIFKSVQGPLPQEVPNRFTSEDADIPYMTWEELKLIQADNELALGGPANLLAAIGLVNDVRAPKSLPAVSGAYLATLTDGTNDLNEVRYLLHEEKRREFFSEGGRYWSEKIQNTDISFFPRVQGSTPFQGYNLQGGVRETFATDEYDSNPYFVARGGLAARGTGCTNLGSRLGNPGSQQPFIE